ncbi:MAG TPA: hypothetical protein DDX75_16680 [Phycisphaerales bacterium]|nr:hypothetical protein [Phycisphaerales bacterium]
MNSSNFSDTRNKIHFPDYHSISISAESKEYLFDFIESINSKLEELEAAALACEKLNDPKENLAVAKRVLHSIKGEAGIIGISEIYEFCHIAESAFEELKLEELPDMLLNIKDWLYSAVDYLKQ